MDTLFIHEISQVIQLAVAPVFLLAGIAGFLTVLSHRLSRVVDRTRSVDRSIHVAQLSEHQELLWREASVLEQRTKIINWAIRLAVGSALAVCLVVMSLFLGDITVFRLDATIAYLFVAAMMLIIFSLLLLLVEIHISTKNLRHGLEHLIVDSNAPTKSKQNDC